MRIVLQRVSSSSVTVAGEQVGAIGPGLLLLVGIGQADDEAEMALWARKCLNLRVFNDEQGKMNASVQDIKGEILAVSQFTLYGNCRKGRRPGFSDAASPERANALYEYFVKQLRLGNCNVATGIFQTHMHVAIHNDGPVTLLLGQDFNVS